MPIIVPIQLLKCLKVLLDENGGILSPVEVKRIASLMTKFSKKLVSKCIYVQILKSTKTELLDEFMSVGGWALVNTWLNDAIRGLNWPLVQEILELLLLCPVDVTRLRINTAPKVVKNLSRLNNNEGVKILALRLVDQWLKKVQQNQEELERQHKPTTVATTVSSSTSAIKSVEMEEDPLALPEMPPTLQLETKKTSSELVYRLVIKDGKQMLAKVSNNDNATANSDSAELQKETAAAAADADDLVEMDDQLDDGNVNDDVIDDIIEDEGNSSEVATLEESSVQEGLDESSSNAAADDVTVAANKSAVDAADSGKEEKNKHKTERGKEHKSSNSSSKEKHDKEKNKKLSSSSNAHKSSSAGHKSSSSSKKDKDGSISSGSSSHHSDRHRSDKHKDKERKSSSSSRDKDKERERSDKSDKDKERSGSSSKHRSSTATSKSHSSSSSSSKEKREHDKQKEKDKDKEKEKSTKTSSSSSSTRKDKEKEREREKEQQAEKDKNTLAEMTASKPSMDKLGKIPKLTTTPTSIAIPSKKNSTSTISIELGREDKPKTVKTFNSQFRSHGLTEKAPPPPSRKDLKKPGTIQTPTAAAAAAAVVAPNVTTSLKRSSPTTNMPASDTLQGKRSKIDINYGNKIAEKPGAIKIIPAPKMPTLVETNMFSDALSASMVPKKGTTKRKRLNSTKDGKDVTSPPATPDDAKVTPPKFYTEANVADKDKEDANKAADKENLNSSLDGFIANDTPTEDDEDIPLKKVKEDIEHRLEKKSSIDVAETATELIEIKEEEGVPEKRQPGPGCGPDGPPGVLMLHRRKGPKKKLTWNETKLENIRYFQVDENERVNVMKTHSFSDMLHMERFSERDALSIARRDVSFSDHMEPKTAWAPLIEVADVPPHPMGNASEQRKVQADREQLTLRALYFSHKMIPDSPSEPELEPHSSVDPPLMPLEDVTGNPDSVNDYTNMVYPAPKGFQNSADDLAGTGGLASISASADMFAEPLIGGVNAFNAFGNMPASMQQQQQQMPPMQIPQNLPPPGWQPPGAPAMFNGMSAMRGNMFNGVPMPGNMPPNFINGPNSGFVPPGGHMPPTFMGPNGPQFGPPPAGFNGIPPNNFGPMGPMPPNGPPMMNGMMAGPPGPMMNGPRGNNRNNFNNNNNTAGGNNWRNNNGPPNNNNNNNNGVCKAFMRGHCRNKVCKYVHPKNKRI